LTDRRPKSRQYIKRQAQNWKKLSQKLKFLLRRRRTFDKITVVRSDFNGFDNYIQFSLFSKTHRHADAASRRFFFPPPPFPSVERRRKPERETLEARLVFGRFALIINSALFRPSFRLRRLRAYPQAETPRSRRRNAHF